MKGDTMEQITSNARTQERPYTVEKILRILAPSSFCIKSPKDFDTVKLPYRIVLELRHYLCKLNRSYITTPRIIIYPDNDGNIRIIKR